MIIKRPLLSDELAYWAIESYAELIPACNLTNRFHSLPLVLATRRFFSAPSGQSHETAEAVFADVKRLMGLENRSYHLLRMREKIEGLDNHNYQDLTLTGGTYEAEGNEAVISYNPETMHIPLNFISTLAHELAHDMLPPPTTAEDIPEHELHTDFLCIVMGFGVIQALGARQAGWAGYLSNEMRMFALAIFLKLRKIPADQALTALDANLAKKLKRGIKQLESMPEAFSKLDLSLSTGAGS